MMICRTVISLGKAAAVTANISDLAIPNSTNTQGSRSLGRAGDVELVFFRSGGS